MEQELEQLQEKVKELEETIEILKDVVLALNRDFYRPINIQNTHRLLTDKELVCKSKFI